MTNTTPNPSGEAEPDHDTHALTPKSPASPLADEASVEPEKERFVFTPPIDIYETEDGLGLQADLPGVSSGTLELQVQDNKLTLFGRVDSTVPENARLLHQEYEVGDYLRSFILSDDVDHDRISAKLNNGVLELALPRTPKSEPKKIQVRTD